MFAWYRVVVLILNYIVLCIHSSNNCKFNYSEIKCNGGLGYMPILSNTLFDYKVVCNLYVKLY